ncbi:Uma2 family endonuclease [Thermomonospora cellulosilytica]|uniref:Uma2 family endonuclease n=1 Tax=Thermomonospora cellulosilytica TaxID=1411118 RepID=A0A7W3N4Z4_9ACTN|nr:Uma2 family endonuclease [Thermomonospora cellulosilytica]MBA9007617.1 Uma2 family endonuclease [Thermomonospora cellulosilytica]
MGVAFRHDQPWSWGPYTIEDLHALPEDGKGWELSQGWLVEMSPSPLHGAVAGNLHDALARAAEAASAPVHVGRGGDEEFSIPAGVRKPDVFVIDSAARLATLMEDRSTYSGADLILVAEVVSRRSGSEQTDRVVKRREYAEAGIPWYWIVDFRPVARIEVLALNDRGAYETAHVAVDDEELKVSDPFPIILTPATLLDV